MIPWWGMLNQIKPFAPLIIFVVIGNSSNRFENLYKHQNLTIVGLYLLCAESGIRTPEPVTVNGFQDRRIRPLCQLSAAKVQIFLFKQNFISNFLFKTSVIKNKDTPFKK